MALAKTAASEPRCDSRFDLSPHAASATDEFPDEELVTILEVQTTYVIEWRAEEE